MKLYYFNPENDMSLAGGSRHLTMSALVQRLHDDGALLPVWYGAPGDLVYAPGAVQDWIDRMNGDFGLDVMPVDKCDGAGAVPWGWSAEASRILRNVGASVISDAQVERLRMLSHRRVSVNIMEALHEMLDFRLPPIPKEVMDVSGVLECLGNWGRVYVKAPWSSSGRGVFAVEKLTLPVEKRVAGILRRQGSVLVECALDKKRDFAMLFRSESGRVNMCGYSLFFNSNGDAYGGNLMADTNVLEDILVAAGASREHLRAIAVALEDVLTRIVAEDYDGYMGVDMLLTSDGVIAPCVELNLRMTMGVVAMLWQKRYLYPGATGLYRVTTAEPHGKIPVIDNGKLVSGVLQLTPSRPGGFFFTVEAGVAFSEF